MSSKKFHVKILTDADEYFKLLSLKDRIKHQEKVFAKQLQRNVLPESKESTTENVESEQTGAGNTDGSFSENLINEIVNRVAERLEKKQTLSIPEQTGTGANDLISDNITNVQVQETRSDINKSLPGESISQKSKLNNEFSDEDLLKTVSVNIKPRAVKLLNALMNHADAITWTPEGTIFLNQQSLPNSNIYFLFPKLFQRVNHPEKVLHLLDLVTSIATLGFAHLINRSLTAGLSRRQKILDQKTILSHINSGKHWWFLGE